MVSSESRKRSRLLTALAVLLWVTTQLAGMPAWGAPTNEQLLSFLKAADQEFLDEFTLDSYVVYPFDPTVGNPGRVLRQLTATRRGDSLVTRSTFVRPVFPVGSPMGGGQIEAISRDGRRFVSLATEVLTLQEPDFIGVLRGFHLDAVVEEDASLSYDPESPGWRGATLAIPDPTKGGYTHEDSLALLTAGRDFSKRIERIVSVREVEDGLLLCMAEGTAHNKPYKWELAVEPRAGYLVRRARAWNPNNGFESFCIENHGTQWFGDIAIPNDGIFWAGTFPDRRDEVRHKYEVTFASYRDSANSDLVDSARELFHEGLPIGTDVFDFRSGDEVPEVYTIGEAEQKQVTTADAERQ
jgi:hypothetical protein